MSIANVRKELQKHDKDGLIDLLDFLYKKDKSVKEYLEFYINPNEADLLSKFKAKVKEAFFKRRSGKIKYSVAKKAIAEFKKFDPSKDLIADIQLYYIECGFEYFRIFGDISNPFYNNFPTIFTNALEVIAKQESLEEFAYRINNIINYSKQFGLHYQKIILDIYKKICGEM